MTSEEWGHQYEKIFLPLQDTCLFLMPSLPPATRHRHRDRLVTSSNLPATHSQSGQWVLYSLTPSDSQNKNPPDSRRDPRGPPLSPRLVIPRVNM